MTAARCALTACLLLAAAVQAAPVIDLPAEAPAQRAVDLEEIWRIDGDDEDVLLGIIFDAVRGPDGAVYLIDRQLSQVVVMSPDGEFTGTLGRQGEGPGELNNPHGLFLLDGGQVGVIQGFPGRITLINPDDTPGGVINVGGDAREGGFVFVRELRACAGALVGTRGRAVFDMEKGTNATVETFAVMDLDGADRTVLMEHSRENDMSRFVFDEAAAFSAFSTWNCGPGEVIYTVPEHQAWTIEARDFAGVLLRTLTRPFETRKRTGEDKEELAADMVVVINGVRQEVENKALDHDAAIDAVHVASDGRLFVRSCWQRRPRLAEGVADRFDVVTPDGAFIEELTLRFPGFDREVDRLIFMDGEHYVLVKNFDAATRSAFAPPAAGDDAEPAAAGDAEPLSVIYLRAS
jgi:hypothetical protein